MATRTLAELRSDVREHAGQQTANPTTSLVQKQELNRRLNEALGLFHNMMAELQRHEWCITKIKTAQIPISNPTVEYDLPMDFFLLSGVPRLSDGDRQYRLLEWGRSERDLLEETDSLPYIQGYEYRINGRTIHILPSPRSNYTLQVDFIPDFTPLAVDGEKIELPHGWWKWATLTAAIDLLNKEKLDSGHLEKQLARWDRQIRNLAGKRGSKRLRVVDTRRDGRLWPRYGRLAEG